MVKQFLIVEPWNSQGGFSMVCLNIYPTLTYTTFQVTNRVEWTFPRTVYCDAASGQWKPCCDLLDLTVGYPLPLLTVTLLKKKFLHL